jgi:hypothetical protein
MTSFFLFSLCTRFSVQQSAFLWLQSYLSDRTFSLSFAGQLTGTLSVDCSVPQGSVLGPLEFIAYTEEVTRVIQEDGVEHHLYADDMQLYANGKPRDVAVIRHRLGDCADHLKSCCASRRLQLNGDKSEIIWFGSHTNLRALAGKDLTLPIGSDVIQPHSVVRDLGVWLDSELTLHYHITKLAAVCFHNLRRLRQLRRRLGKMSLLVWSLPSSLLGWTTATQCSPAYHSPPSRLYSAYKMLQPALCFHYDRETLLRLL